MSKRARVTLAHGSGGVETEEIVNKLILSKVPSSLRSAMNGVGLNELDDGASLVINDLHVVISSDSYTVNPPVFPGGNIGTLAAAGTINDVLMMGAKPVALMDSIVVAEGFEIGLLSEILESMMSVLKENKVALIGGDFKTMPKDDLNSIVISTVGIGVAKKPIVDSSLKPGDKIIVSGYVGDHGATILALQQGIELSESKLKSDVKPLTDLMIPLLEEYGEHIHAARDPTRGGLAMLLNDWAASSGTVIVIEEDKIPVREEVLAYSEMLGIDPLSLASEGVAVLGVARDVAEDVLNFIKEKGFREASIIGEVKAGKRYSGIVLYKSSIGGTRILEPPRGEIVPRIC
ncbi:MAG: hydrogenase expression/formation protein HypE [Thermoprotei archaeon]|nr:MAG: hydrogenase expression/formation protein HypE [Thermoprotei archaeon]